ncbi:helix-turn-helix transcriptional regulator [Nocardia alba]|uniref:helix-turn-helix transcriptional regulator n=1 Tax=Nocardia alba TaxID=225051 RepID=UPI0008350E99|nr:helix-turn-helix domain-containing protein [Nocardia alba]
MQSLDFESDDLAATEGFLNDAYTRVEIGNHSSHQVRTRIRREVLGSINFDRLDMGFDMGYDADPLGRVCLVTVNSGRIEANYHDHGPDTFTPGQTGLLTPHDLPYSGVIRTSRYDVTMFDPAILNRIATAEGGARVRVDGHRPVNPAAGQRLCRVITHLRLVAADPDAADSPLTVTTAADYLAATVLATMPTTAEREPNTTDRHDAHPHTVRRAIAYLESHLGDRVAITDVAAATFVTPRALQLAFRRHLDTTPLEYLQRMRLAAAHEQLRAALPGDGLTVAAVAFRWGFTHPGRFATAYRHAYGQPPKQTLNE